MAPDIEMKDLLPMPIQKQAESVQEFIRKSAIEVNKTPVETEKIPYNQKLQELSQKTGISMQTLLQVKTVEHQVKEQRAVIDKSVLQIDEKKKTDQLVTLAS
jgi:hypothetical protein